jgi:hypothetical protein
VREWLRDTEPLALLGLASLALMFAVIVGTVLALVVMGA